MVYNDINGCGVRDNILQSFESIYTPDQFPIASAAGLKIELREKKKARKGMDLPLFSPSSSFRGLPRRLLASCHYNKLHHTR